MLSTAMNFLSEKRKKQFQRSDTAPTLSLPGTKPEVDQRSPSPETKLVSVLRRREKMISSKSGSATSLSFQGTEKRRLNSNNLDIEYFDKDLLTRPLSTNLDKKPSKSHEKLLQPQGSPTHGTINSRRSNSVDLGRQSKMTVNKSVFNSPSAPSKLNRHGLRKRQSRLNSVKTVEELKRERGRNDKLVRETSELFLAIEQGNVSEVKRHLMGSQVTRLLNTTNQFNLSPLDLAMLTLNNSLAELLISYGAFNNPNLCDFLKMKNHLNDVISELNRRKCYLMQDSKATDGRLSEIGKNIDTINLLNKNLDKISPPNPVSIAQLEINSSTSLRVTIQPPHQSVVIKYKLQWSIHPDFYSIDGEIAADVQYPWGIYIINGLRRDQPYYVRVFAMNLKGWGLPRITQPPVEKPSSWFDLCKYPDRTVSFQNELNDIYGSIEQELCFWLTSTNSENKKIKSPIGQRRRSFKSIFSSGSKFVRHLKYGIYIGFIAVCYDKIVTLDDAIPFIPVTDSSLTSSQLNSECQWLMRLLADCPDLKLAAQTIERLTIPTSIETRVCCLYSILQLQASIGTSDVGRIHTRIIESHGVSIISLVKIMEESREVTLSSGLKWTSLSKALKRGGNTRENSGNITESAEEEFYRQLESFIVFGVECNSSVESGLYLSHVRLDCNLDELKVEHFIRKPNFLPSCKVRDNPHISYDEWKYLVELGEIQPNSSNLNVNLPMRTAQCAKFHDQLIRSWHKLHSLLDLKDDYAETCRLYLHELVVLSEDVSLLIVCSSPDQICSTPGHSAIRGESTTESTSLNAFENNLFTTFDPDFFAKFATLQGMLEIFIPLSHQVLRQSFVDKEIEQSKRRLNILKSAQAKLDEMWKIKRWTFDVISAARDKQKVELRSLALSKLIDIQNLYLKLTKSPIETGHQFVRPKLILNDRLSCQVSIDNFSSDIEKMPENFFNHDVVNRFSPQSPFNRQQSSNSSYSEELLSPTSPVFPVNSSDSSPDSFNSQYTGTPTEMSYDDYFDQFDQSSQTRPYKEGDVTVFAGIDCGLDAERFLVMQINSNTTAKDIITHILENMIQPGLSQEEAVLPNSDDFTLMVKVGGMERPLPEEFHPLLLQLPWSNGKLIVKNTKTNSNILATDV